MKPRLIWILTLLCLVLAGVATMMGRAFLLDSRAREAEMCLANERAAVAAEIKKLQITIRDQEDRVEDLGKVLKTIAETKARIHDESAAPHASCEASETAEAGETVDRYAKLDDDSTRIELYLGRFLYLEEAPLMMYANGLDVPDNPVKPVFPAYIEALRGREQLRNNGLNDQQPEVQAAIRQVNVARAKTRKAIADFKAGLQTRLEAVARQRDAATDSLDAAYMVNVNTRFNAAQELLGLMRGKLASLRNRQMNDLKQPPNH